MPARGSRRRRKTKLSSPTNNKPEHGGAVAKRRVYEIARELGRESKAVLERAQELGLAVSTASSGLEEDDAALLVLSFEEDSKTGESASTGLEARVTEVAEEVDGSEAGPDEQPVPEQPAEAEDEVPSPEIVELAAGTTPAEFAQVIDQPVTDVVEALSDRGHVVAADAPIPTEAFDALGDHFGLLIDVEQLAPEKVEPPPRPTFDDADEDLEPRAPVVTVMGHVDHGKTSLLDRIRKTNVVEGEAGGITQHIGAYQVEINASRITFIDTPGHEAFTAMRARGANVTDIVVLVVAADDGPMPQTVEAIDHARAADVPIIVAINKIDLPTADPHSVRARLTEYGLVAEELGGDTVTVDVSAETGEGIDTLLEMIGLVAEVEELNANPNAPASGVVVESRLDKGMGPVATVIVQRGTLRVGDGIVAGGASGRVRALIDDQGERVKEAPPSTPVMIMGWDDVPAAGDYFEVVGNEREARARAEAYNQELRRAEMVIPSARDRLEQLLEQLRSTDEAELRLIVKADAHGSLEALRDAIGKIKRDGGSVTIIHGGVGGISENDVMLAEATGGVVVGFAVRPDGPARRAAERRGVEIRTYRVIYEMLGDIEQMLLGRLAPEEVEAFLGSAEVRATFRVPRRGTVAGCYVTEGEIRRGAAARLVRDGVVVYDGRIDSLRRFKDDVQTVAAGFECGVGLEGFNDIKEGDVIEVYEVREVART
jgi:translation initiation factor IF-2